jgi:hypothetical protein
MHQSCELRASGAERKENISWRRWAIAAQALAGAATVATAAGATTAPVLSPAAQAAYLKSHMANVHAWKPMTVDAPTSRAARLAKSRLLQGLGVGTTVPFWTTNITSPLDGNTYTVSMVGSSPYAATKTNTNVTYVPVAVRIHLGGFVIDPTAVSHCDTQSAARRFFNSPIFRPNNFVSNGVNVSNVPGGTQLISAFQRANFWNAVKGTGYGVTLIPSRLDPIVVDWYPTNPSDSVLGIPDNCGGVQPVPLVEINEFDAELQSIAATYATPAQVPVSLALDTAIYVTVPSNCCVLGYHNAISVAGGTQLYAVGAFFDTNGAFGPHFADTTIWAHELGELVDDPFVQSIPGAPGGVNNDLTPAWGHTGQVSGCQNNLEVGDPLTPDQGGNYGNYPVVGVGGFVYHYQDLAFHDWFYRTPSTSTGGKYSFVGNFTTVQGVCS